MRESHAGNGHALRYVPYDALGDTPNIIVDGAPQEATVLTLSHWPGSGTPVALKADTSTESCFRYLSAPEVAPAGSFARAVSNNHVDVDGILGMWALLNPRLAWEHLEDVVAAATADDFGRVQSDRGGRVALALSALARDGYETVLPKVTRVLTNLHEFEPLYGSEWKRYLADRHALDTGRATFEEHPDVDLAVFRSTHRLHEWAENSATDRCRVVDVVDGRVIGMRYRYETWVQFVSRALMPRVDLSGLIPLLDEHEGNPLASWQFDGISDIVPRLTLETPGGEPVPSRIEPEHFVALVAQHLREHQANPSLTWNPYDPS